MGLVTLTSLSTVSHDRAAPLGRGDLQVATVSNPLTFTTPITKLLDIGFEGR